MACVSAFGTRESKRADFCKPSSSYARSTAAENIPDSSTKPASSGAWNLIFTLQRRGPPRRRAWKLLLLYHTHGSASKSLYMPCEIMVQMESTELKHIYRISWRKNWDVEVVSVVDLIAYMFFGGHRDKGGRHGGRRVQLPDGYDQTRKATHYCSHLDH